MIKIIWKSQSRCQLRFLCSTKLLKNLIKCSCYIFKEWFQSMSLPQLNPFSNSRDKLACSVFYIITVTVVSADFYQCKQHLGKKGHKSKVHRLQGFHSSENKISITVSFRIHKTLLSYEFTLPHHMKHWTMLS